MPGFSRLHAAVVGLLFVLCGGAAAAQDREAEWPCPQRKVETLTSTQMWDGPAVEDLTAWREDAEIARILPALVSRRVPIEEATGEVRRFAERTPEERRDARLSLLFAGLLKTVNDDRAVVLRGIERFQNRQRARAAELERQGVEIAGLKVRAAKDPKAKEELVRAEERYHWDARVFTERQQSIPLACEVPVLIEQRLFDLGREIRSHMKE